ncbi:phosphatase PAP2 family protein, partial [Actinotalea sp. C106]|uniref:phosphatase PAP2 family protein n=1 Tax=Actinotalea sp. C106 TaxID=2908644 RepID=UPI0027E142CF
SSRRARARAAVDRLRSDRPALVPQVAVLLGLAFVVLGTAGFIGVLDAVQENDDLALLDEPALEFLVQARTETLTGFLTVVSTVSGPVVLPVLIAVTAILWGALRRAWWPAALLTGAMIASSLVSLALKSVIARPRPPVDSMTVAGVESTYSFPSGHTIGAATFLLVLGYLLWIRRPSVPSLLLWLVGTALGILLVAMSRLYLGYHFVSDVVASMALALAVLGGVIVLDRRRAIHAVRRTATSEPADDPGPGPGVS